MEEKNEYPKPATKQCTKKIVEQMENSFYKIETIDKKYGIGIFSYIKYQNNKISILITNNNLINQENKNKIKVFINNSYQIIELKEIKYIIEESDIIIIEIKYNGKDNINYLELDDILYEKQSELYFIKESIYFLHVTNEDKILVSYDLIDDLNENYILYKYPNNTKYKYSLIFCLSNNKMIGIHNNSCCNEGIIFN